MVKLESLVLCDDFKFSQDQNNQLNLYGVGGVVFTAPFPRGLCYLYARVSLPQLVNQTEFELKAILTKDDLPNQPSIYNAPTKWFKRMPQPFLRTTDPEPAAVIFDFNDVLIRNPGHYKITVYCGSIELGSTNFELRDLPAVESFTGAVVPGVTTSRAIPTQY